MRPPALPAAPAAPAAEGVRLPAEALAAAGAERANDSRCPRCGGGFHCGVNDANPCACSRLPLSAAQLADLRQRYGSCLCLACLLSLPP